MMVLSWPLVSCVNRPYIFWLSTKLPLNQDVCLEHLQSVIPRCPVLKVHQVSNSACYASDMLCKSLSQMSRGWPGHSIVFQHSGSCYVKLWPPIYLGRTLGISWTSDVEDDQGCTSASVRGRVLGPDTNTMWWVAFVRVGWSECCFQVVFVLFVLYTFVGNANE